MEVLKESWAWEHKTGQLVYTAAFGTKDLPQSPYPRPIVLPKTCPPKLATHSSLGGGFLRGFEGSLSSR